MEDEILEVPENVGEGVLVDDEGHPVRLGDDVPGPPLAGHDSSLSKVPARPHLDILVLHIPDADIARLDRPLIDEVEIVCLVALVHEVIALCEALRSHHVDKLVHFRSSQFLEEINLAEQLDLFLGALLRLGLQNVPERLLIDAEEDGSLEGLDRRGARAIVQQRKFPEGTARLGPSDFLAIDFERARATLQDVKVISLIALLDDDRMRFDGGLLESLDQRRRLFRFHVLEDEVPLEGLFNEFLFFIRVLKFGRPEGGHIQHLERGGEDVPDVVRGTTLAALDLLRPDLLDARARFGRVLAITAARSGGGNRMIALVLAQTNAHNTYRSMKLTKMGRWEQCDQDTQRVACCLFEYSRERSDKKPSYDRE